MCLFLLLPLALFISCTWSINFAYESTQLTEADIGDFSSIGFGDVSCGNYTGPECKVEPGDAGWPTEEEWAAFNSSLGGSLLKPVPAEAVCYPGPHYDSDKCDFLLGPVNSTRFYLDDPLSVLTQWPEGNTCDATLHPSGNCTQGGYPLYVVNSTTVRDIQLAVNFARNKNIRLNIKNTGHDFVGRSTGQASLSVWTHYLKNIEFLPSYDIAEYHGPAARISAGLEAFEAYNAMIATNNTIVAPGDLTVGVGGGWMAGGGHSTLTSFYGLGSDQVLSVNVVTADGRFITADLNQNQDLFFALRGGGGSTYGIVTSAIFKAYSHPIDLGFVAYSLATGPVPPPDNPNPVFPTAPAIEVLHVETFWQGYNIFLAYTKKSCDAGAISFGDLTSLGNNSFLFTSSFFLVNQTADETSHFMHPLFEALRAAGINMTDPEAMVLPNARETNGTGAVPGNTLFASRLFPRSNWDNATLFNLTTAAIRRTVEAGLTFNGLNYAPTLEVAGYPGNSSAANPAFRTTLMHATVFEPTLVSALTPADFMAKHDRLAEHMGEIRSLTPGGGAYINEADVLEPNWQQSFFGSNYNRLLEIKKAFDPWGLFWAPTTVGSEAWKVRTADGVPTQNGPLCRTGV